MSDRTYAKVQAQQKTLSGSSPRSSLLQRTCACGQHTIAGAQCSTCRSEPSTWHHSQRAFEPPSTSGAVQGNSPLRKMGLHSTLPLVEHHASDTILARFPSILLQ